MKQVTRRWLQGLVDLPPMNFTASFGDRLCRGGSCARGVDVFGGELRVTEYIA